MFGAARQRRGIDLHDRAEHDELPVGPRGGDAGEQLEVHPLVDHAEESEPRVRDRRLVGGIRRRSAAPARSAPRRRCSETDERSGASAAWLRRATGRR